MDRTKIQSKEIKKTCKKHGKIFGDLVYFRNSNRDSHSVYCPHCVEDLLLEHLKPLWETFPVAQTLSFE